MHYKKIWSSMIICEGNPAVCGVYYGGKDLRKR